MRAEEVASEPLIAVSGAFGIQSLKLEWSLVPVQILRCSPNA